MTRMDPSVTLAEEAMEPVPEPISAIGSVTGIVQMLSYARGIAFSIRDERSGRVLRSTVSDDFTEDLRAVWGRRAVIEGTITRDSTSGAPVRLSAVTGIAPVREVPAGAFLRARGALRVAEDSEPPEVTIRRLRDAS